MADGAVSREVADEESQCLEALHEEEKGSWCEEKNVLDLRSKLDEESAQVPLWEHVRGDATLLRRFLVQRRGNVESARTSLIRHLQWRMNECASWFPGLPPPSEVVRNVSACFAAPL
jgi:hypothetical protein